MEEQWRDIIIEKNGILYDYTGLYQVSNLGRVRSLGNDKTRKEKILKPGINNKGYQYVNLYKNGKGKLFSVHRLVATMFIPNPENLTVVNHKDENKLNNCVDNLEWVTMKYNISYGTRSERASEKMKGQKRSEEAKQKMSKTHKKVRVICLETKQVFDSIKEAEQCIGKGNISQHLKGRAKSAGKHPVTGQPLHWQYYCED